MQCKICDSKNIIRHAIGRSTVAGYRCKSKQESLKAPLFDISLDQCLDCNIVSQHRHPEADQLLDKLYIEHESTQHSIENKFFEDFANELGRKYSLSSESKVLEIGCNCGLFLHLLRAKTGAQVFGIEPSLAMKNIWKDRNLTIINQYMDQDSAELLKKVGPFEVIYFRHVFEHVPDPMQFIKICESMLSNKGSIVVEVPYLPSIFKYGRYENISYSHLHQYSISSLDAIFSKFGLGMVEFELVSNDGGSIIAHFQKGVTTNQELLEPELYSDFIKFLGNAEKIKEKYKIALSKYEKGQVVGYGAGAKGQHLIHVLGLTEIISQVIDDTPGFEGYFIPGTDIEIKNSSVLNGENIKAVLNLAPTHSEVIQSKIPSKLKFIDPINNVY